MKGVCSQHVGKGDRCCSYLKRSVLKRVCVGRMQSWSKQSAA